MKIEVNQKYRPKSWSYSAISAFEQCAWKFYLERGEKMQQEAGFALVNGVRIHSLAEEYLKGNITGIPKDLKKLDNEMRNLKKHGAIPEEEICLDRHWQPVKGEDAWKNSKTWIRAKIDARVPGADLVVDFKTGRAYDKYAEQAELYATLIYQAIADVGDVLTVEFWYTKTGEVQSYEFLRDDQESRLNRWDKRAAMMMAERNWFPKQNEFCRFCHVQEHCELYKE